MSRFDYLYAAGVVRFWENKLLNPTDIKRMVYAPDLESAYKVFNDTDYFDNVLDVKPTEFIKALDADLAQAKARVIEMTPDERVVEFIFKRYDYHNLKLFLKQKYAGIDLSGYISTLGNLPPEKIKALVAGERNIELSRYLKEAYDYVSANLGAEVGPREIERLVDKAYFTEHARQADELKCGWIKKLVAWQIDIANLKILIRGERLSYDKKEIASEFVSGGKIEHNFLLSLVGLSEEEMIAGLESHLTINSREVLDNFLKSKSLAGLERDLENLEVEYIKKAKFIDFGPELVIAYYAAKKNAVRNVRLIMMGKLNNLPAKEIEEMLRVTY